MFFSGIFTFIASLLTTFWFFLHNTYHHSDQLNHTLINYNFSCGISNSNLRIINGISTRPNMWPWIVSLRTRDSFFNKISNHICAGTIIDFYTIITAAHCVKDQKTKNLVIIAGISNLQDKIQKSNIFSINYINYHSLYNIIENDIALIILSDKLKFGEKIQPICLPPKWTNTKNLFNKTLTLIGW